jgi:hypothetical protein
LNCCGAASSTWGANLVKDFKKALNNESGGFCDDIVCAYFIDHDTAIFFVGCLVV